MERNTTNSADECQPRPEARDLPRENLARLLTLLKRAFLLRCPLCGSGGIFTSLWGIVECCPKCGYRFAREDGYFLGAYAINLIVAEILGLGIVLYFLLTSDLSVIYQQVIAVLAAITLPLVFFPFSRTLWMTLDLMVERNTEEKQVRTDQIR